VLNFSNFWEQSFIWIAGLIFHKYYIQNHYAFQFQRFLLLFILLSGIIIPYQGDLLDYKIGDVYTFQLDHSTLSLNSFNSVNKFSFTLYDLIFCFYLIVLIFLTIRFIIRVRSLHSLISNNIQEQKEGGCIIVYQNIESPFSFFHYIFLPQTLRQESSLRKAVITHETCHALNCHSLDMIIIEIIRVIFWYNPLITLIKSRLLLVHEYQADQFVKKDISAQFYSDMLLKLTFSASSPPVSHSFSSQLKNRIIMLNKILIQPNPIQKMLIYSLFVIIMLSVHECAPSVSSIGKPIHVSRIDTMEIFDPSTLKSDLKIVKNEFEYYNEIPEMPFLVTCAYVKAKDRNTCTLSTITSGIMNDESVLLELKKINKSINAKILITVLSTGQALDPFPSVNTGYEKLDIAIKNSIIKQEYFFVPGRVNKSYVNVQLIIPLQWTGQ